MIRKAIIVMLTLGALGTAVIWLLSYGPASWGFSYIGEWRFSRSTGRGLAATVASDETSHEYWIASANAGVAVIQYFFVVNPNGYHSAISHRIGNFAVCREPAYEAGQNTRIVRRVAQRKQKALGPILYLSGLVTPLWAPFVLVATYPTLAFIRGPVRRYRRRRRALCVKYGYNLTGNVSSVCSECGTRIEKR